MTNSIDIKAKAPFPAGALPNLAATAFTFDGVAYASTESLLQSLKVAGATEQETYCRLQGAQARGRRSSYASPLA